MTIQPHVNSKTELAFDFIQNTNTNLFLTGKAGTGKTTFLRSLGNRLSKRMIVVAPTGVAAVNAGGVTIHSFFQIPFGPYLPGSKSALSIEPHQRFNRIKIKIMKSIDLLVIDEISMVRCDLLDAVDEVLRRFKDRNKPFGGVQLLMIGDLQQLAPVVKDDERELLSGYYDSFFFFGSHALQKTNYVCIELTHIYRQKDKHFIELLNKIGANQIDDKILSDLNKRFDPDYSRFIDKGYISLTTHNYQSQQINNSKLAQLPGQTYTFEAEVNGDFPEYAYPADSRLILKTGAQVMFIKNDTSPEKLFYNGKIGTVTEINDEAIFVKCPGAPYTIAVMRMEWSNTRYTIDDETKAINEEVIGTFTQYPLKLAWAITIHKSQGLTFDHAIIDAQQAFAHGQVYVALSRCRTLEGIVLSSMISARSLRNDVVVSDYILGIPEKEPDSNQLQMAKAAFFQSLMVELFDFSSLTRRFGYLMKLLIEHQSILHPAFIDGARRVQYRMNSEMTAVAEKFAIQIKTAIAQNGQPDENGYLIERLKSAGRYFKEKAGEIIITFFTTNSIETDNKQVRKSLSEVVERILEEIAIKSACFGVCENGYTLKNFLEARAVAGIEDIAVPRKKSKEQPIYDESAKETEIYGLLKEWRTYMAAEMDVAPYMIMHNKVLILLSTRLPDTLEELKLIKGLGQRKINQYGEQLLAIISDYKKQLQDEVSG